MIAARKYGRDYTHEENYYIQDDKIVCYVFFKRLINCELL